MVDIIHSALIRLRPIAGRRSPITASQARLALLAIAAVVSPILVSPIGAQAPAQPPNQPAAQTGVLMPTAPEVREARFRIFARGVPVGTESVRVETTPAEIKIVSTGQMNPAVSFQLNDATIRYDRAWRPLGLTMEARIKDKPLRIMTTVAGGKATSTIVQDDQSQSPVHDVAENTILLPNNVYGGYEAVVARLATIKPGETLRAYIAPQAEIAITLDSVATEQVKTTERTFASKHYLITAQNPGGPLKMEVWADDRDRLMRFLIPQVPVDVVREDIAAVSTRQQTTFRGNDEDVFILANGFNLAATISKPASADPPPPPPAEPGKPAPKPAKVKPIKLPALILVAGSGPLNRDESVAGIPIFAQLANALADAGYLVVRYDKRGVGQSGGRMESATLNDYAEDVRAIVRFLSKRKDVDRDRIAVVGHSEGAAVAMLAARADKNIRSLVLIAGPGTSGAELILEQQQTALKSMKVTDVERASKVDLQKRIQAAAVSGNWDGIPPELQRQADTLWFRSLLTYDPAKVMEKVKQPMLIVQGDLDQQVPPHHADKLAALGKARKKATDVQVAHFPTLNHLLVPAKTGEVSEYAKLETKTVAPDVATKIAEWLKATMVPKT